MGIKKIERAQIRETIDLIWTTFFAITVNSSPYAVPVYRKLGFVETDTEQLADGMRYTPMKFVNACMQ